jgi:hypothetical protein
MSAGFDKTYAPPGFEAVEDNLYILEKNPETRKEEWSHLGQCVNCALFGTLLCHFKWCLKDKRPDGKSAVFKLKGSRPMVWESYYPGSKRM